MNVVAENPVGAETELRRFVGRAKCVPADPGKLFLPFQSRWVEDEAQRKLAVKSRQIGWTWITAYRVVTKKLPATARQDAWLSSRDEQQARLFLEDCTAWADVLEIGAHSIGCEVVDAAGNTAYVLKLANGRRIYSTSSNPDAQAGKRGDRILDEFALHADPKKLYGVASPGITWGGALEIFSTPRGVDNYFHELIQEIKHGGNPKGFSLHEVTLQKALEEGLLYKLQSKLPEDDPRQAMDEAAYFDAVRAGCPDEATFLEEYMCQPGDERSAFLSHELIGGCEYGVGEEWQYHVSGSGLGVVSSNGERPDLTNSWIHIGVDVGRDRDLTVIWVVEKLGDVAYTRAVITLEQATFEEQEQVLYEWLALPQMFRCCIDQTGMGRQFAERAQQRFGKYRVEAVTFTSEMKEALAYPVRAALEGRKVRLPNDPVIRADLRAVRKEMSASHNIRITADRGRNGHADRFWALALALHAGTRVSVPRATVG